MSQVVYKFFGKCEAFLSHTSELCCCCCCCCCCWCQVYCLPFASGSSLVFAPWEDEVIEVVAVARRPRWRSNQKVDGLQIKGLETQNAGLVLLGWREGGEGVIGFTRFWILGKFFFSSFCEGLGFWREILDEPKAMKKHPVPQILRS